MQDPKEWTIHPTDFLPPAPDLDDPNDDIVML